MLKVEIKLDHAGVASVLKSAEVAAMVSGFAHRVRASVAVPAGVEVVVTEYVTDRAAAAVTILDARAKLWQVRDGVLTRAAAANGAEVKGH